MFASQFDGNAAFSGGGFMPSQATQTADPSFSSAKNRDTQGLLPLTVKQVNEAYMSSDDKTNFLIDGVDINNVKLVGILCNKAERVTDVTFVLDDGTGRIDCNRWVNDPTDSSEMEGIMDGMYIRVHGHLKSFQGKKQLLVYSIRPVTDYDEIANHFVECIYVHFYNTKSRKQQPIAPTPAQIPRGYQATPPNQYVRPQLNEDQQYTPLAKSIFKYLEQPSIFARGEGCSYNEIAQQLNVHVDKIKEAAAPLLEEGVIYSTIDDLHIKSARNG